MFDYRENGPILRSNPNIRFNYSNKQSEMNSNITPDIEECIETPYYVVNDSENESQTMEKPTKDPVIYDVNPEKSSEVTENSTKKVKTTPKENLNSNININTNINKCRASSTVTNAKISGKVLDKKTCSPIKFASVSLFRKYLTCDNKLITTTHTNENGEYIFTDVTSGIYIIKITANSYTTKCSCVAMLGELKPITLTTMLKKDDTLSDCCVFGIVKNSCNKPINNAKVILSRLNADNTYTNVNMTRTNNCGKYTFKNVPNGHYKVTANNIDISSLTIDGSCKRIQIYNN